MKNLRMVLIVVILIGLSNSVEAGWRDKLDKAMENVRSAAKKTKETTKKAVEKTKDTASKAKKKYDDLQHPCPVCGEMTRLKGKCRKCLSKSIQAGGKRVTDFSKRAYEKAAQRANVVYAQANKKYAQVVDKIKDPEVRRKTGETVGAVLELRKKYKETKWKGAYKGMQALASVPIPGRYGEMTNLGDFASDKLLEKCPGLASTGIADDPAATVAAMICTDRKYFLKEMKFVKKGGRNVSVYEAVDESSAFNSAKASKAFKVMAATERVANTYYTGEDSVEALTSVADAINSVNK